jgi:hypothetical protein
MKNLMMIAMVATMFLSVAAFGQNLITNGDFEDPLTFVSTGTNLEGSDIGYFQEITSEYTALNPTETGTWTLGPEYIYTVSTDPSLYHSAWTSFPAHGGSKMMIVNGTWDDYSPDYDAIVWAQTVEDLECVPIYPETTVTLYAGQTWDAGDVLVKTSADGVCVKFVLNQEAIDEDWVITEVHVDVADTAANIPNKNGNPIPGKFEIKEKLDPGVTETEWYCLETDADPVIIAAHVKLELPEIGHLDDNGTPDNTDDDFWVVDRPYDSETGWGDGDDFPGKNWATYIEYTPEDDCDYGSYLLEFWAGNSFPGNPTWPAQPAILEVQINSVVVGTLSLEYNPPYAPTPGWMQFSATWDAGSDTSAIIEIRDTRHIMYGDDFVIDDISFVKQP